MKNTESGGIVIKRISRLREVILKSCDMAVITSPVNRRYYTGFPSSAGTILVTKNESYFIIDSRYYEAACKKAAGFKVILQDKLYSQINEIIEKEAVRSITVEQDRMTLKTFKSFKENLKNAELLDNSSLSDAINNQRRIKDAEEISKISQAAKIADRTFEYILNFIKPGITEKEIALKMEFYSREIGSAGNSFDFIIASGPNSAVPHAVPTDREIRQGDFIVMDFGCIIDGCCSDMTRTIAVGEISSKQKEVYSLVLKAQEKALLAVKPGIACNEVDKIARDIIDTGSYKGTFGHGLGHSLGLEIHEDPRFSPLCADVLEKGMVMSVEPGIYIPGQFGVRIEDIIAVTEDSYINLADSPKELIIL